MKKKIISLLVVCISVLALTGCGIKKKEAASTSVPATENANVKESAVTEKVEDDVRKIVGNSVKDSAEAKSFKTIEDYYSIEENYNGFMRTLQGVYEKASGTYDNISFEISGNTVTYKYIFLDGPIPEIHPDIYFAKITDEQWASIRDDIVRDSGVTDDIKVVYEYYTYDGDLVDSYSTII